jgi:hypothetical protein
MVRRFLALRAAKSHFSYKRDVVFLGLKMPTGRHLGTISRPEVGWLGFFELRLFSFLKHSKSNTYTIFFKKNSFMKKLRFFVLFAWAVCASGILAAQTSVPRYVLVEHFTNSRCVICASRNPAMYTTLDANAAQVHHLSVHPSVPYSNCVFYQANTVENNARADYYDVDGTPRVALNGTLVPQGSMLLPAATLNAQLNQTSGTYVRVNETATSATVSVTTFAAPPSGDYVLQVALAERVVNFQTPNGESVHRDVFRDMLSNISGDAFTPPAVGQTIDFQYAKPSNPNWVADQVYLVAWIQNTQTKEVLNSGTRFDPVVSSVGEAAAQSLTLTPNPADHETRATLPDGQVARQVRVFATDGRLVSERFEVADQQVRIGTEALSPGAYVVHIVTDGGTYVARLVK